MRRIAGLTILALFAAALLAADGLSPQFKQWPASPEAYFLTSEEKAQWKGVKDDAQAKEFVAGYYARRSPDLPKTLKERIDVADKYFSAGKVKGSETLRGKVIIVFGPPSEIRQTGGDGAQGRAGTSDRASVTLDVPDPHGNVGPGAAGLTHSEHDPIFIIGYDDQHAPRSIGKGFRVELKMKSAARQEAVKAEELEQNFETVAKASITPK